MANVKENNTPVKRHVRRRRVSPFKNVQKLEKDISTFVSSHRAKFAEHGKRLSEYFEISCYNHIVKYYKKRGYTVEVQNLKGNIYKYKFSTQGNQENFSHFKVTRGKGENIREFGVYHNLAIQSSHDKNIYVTPDISVVEYGKLKVDEEHYTTKRKLSFAPNNSLVSFFEAKQYTPFPELIINFIGIVHELRPAFISNSQDDLELLHLAPSIMVSGKPNPHLQKIKNSLEKRHCINVVYDLFIPYDHPFSTLNFRKLATIKRVQNLEPGTIELKDVEDLPF